MYRFVVMVKIVMIYKFVVMVRIIICIDSW